MMGSLHTSVGSNNTQGQQGQSNMQAGPPLRKGQPSGPSRKKTYISFVNKTSRHVDVIWINYQGLGVKYTTLRPDGHLNVNTYVGHPWIFYDRDTGERMQVEFKRTYQPTPWEGGQRKQVYITLPVFTLLERSLQVVRRMVPRNSIPQLEIPSILQMALMHPRVDISVTSSASDFSPHNSAAGQQHNNNQNLAQAQNNQQPNGNG